MAREELIRPRGGPLGVSRPEVLHDSDVRPTSVHRPSADGGASRRERNAVGSSLRCFRRGARACVNARSAWNVSLVIDPFHTRFQSAATVSLG